MKPHHNPFHQNIKMPYKKNNVTLYQSKEKFDPEMRLKQMKEAEPATPWSTFKSELLIANANETDAVAKTKLNKAEQQSYKRTLIKQKYKEPTKWEDFKSDPSSEIKNFKKNKKRETKTMQELFANKELDVKKLTPGQNNFLRGVITATTCLHKGSTLKQVVGNMQKKDQFNRRNGKPYSK